MPYCIRLTHQYCLILVCCSWLIACGWQLKGWQSNSVIQHEVQLSLAGHLAPSLQQMAYSTAASVGIRLKASAPAVLAIVTERFDKRSLSLTETGITAQYQITLSIDYHYTANTHDRKKTVSIRRRLDVDPSNALQNRQEEKDLLHSMREELLVRIFRSLPATLPEPKEEKAHTVDRPVEDASHPIMANLRELPQRYPPS